MRLLYLSERPLTAEEIAATLGLARSNVSTSIRELMAWNLVRRVPVKGDRREHFEAETDLWEIAMRIAAVRKEREIDPAVEALRACVADAERDPKLHPVAAKRLNDMLAFVEAMDRWYAQMLTVPKPKLATLDPPRHPHHQPAAARQAEVAVRGANRCLRQLLRSSPGNSGAWAEARSRSPKSELGDLRFRALMSEAEWASLPPRDPPPLQQAPRRRADDRLCRRDPRIVDEPDSGWWLAQAARLIGGPLAGDVAMPMCRAW